MSDDVHYRISVRKFGENEPIMFEQYEAKSDADKFFNGLFDEDSILNSLKGTFCIQYYELYKGNWIPTVTKTVISE